LSAKSGGVEKRAALSYGDYLLFFLNFNDAHYFHLQITFLKEKTCFFILRVKDIYLIETKVITKQRANGPNGLHSHLFLKLGLYNASYLFCH